MTFLRLLLVVLPLAVLLPTLEARGGERPLPDPVEGSRLFVQKGCVVCHAVDGEGGEDRPRPGTGFQWPNPLGDRGDYVEPWFGHGAGGPDSRPPLAESGRP